VISVVFCAKIVQASRTLSGSFALPNMLPNSGFSYSFSTVITLRPASRYLLRATQLHMVFKRLYLDLLLAVSIITSVHMVL
jgi:hypothetical protein